MLGGSLAGPALFSKLPGVDENERRIPEYYY